jgi:hypothetical protein
MPSPGLIVLLVVGTVVPMATWWVFPADLAWVFQTGWVPSVKAQGLEISHDSGTGL